MAAGRTSESIEREETCSSGNAPFREKSMSAWAIFPAGESWDVAAIEFDAVLFPIHSIGVVRLRQSTGYRLSVRQWFSKLRGGDVGPFVTIAWMFGLPPQNLYVFVWFTKA